MTDEADNPEVFIRDDESWIPNGDALKTLLGALYITRSDGDLYAGIIGRGEVPVADLLKEMGAPSKPALASVKPIK